MVGVFFDGDGQECFEGFDLVVREEEAAARTALPQPVPVEM